jgi:hypothetical protein
MKGSTSKTEQMHHSAVRRPNIAYIFEKLIVQVWLVRQV